jgi:dienelactone hydrolase
MKTLALGLTLTLSAVCALPHAAGAQAAAAWPSVTDFAAPGPFAITHEMNVGPDAGYDIVRPAQLGAQGRKHPVISWNNGTLYPIADYQPLLDHWASHGFVVIGAHTNSTRGGAVHKAGIDWIVAEAARSGSAYFNMLDVARIGAAGHSQGAGATITAGADIPGPMPIATSIAMMPISAFERPHLAQHQASMLLVSATDDDRANTVADQALADVTTEIVDAQFIGVHADAMHPGMHGPTAAWFRYQLMGDATARAQFYPPMTCGLCGDEAWERLRYANSPR